MRIENLFGYFALFMIGCIYIYGFIDNKYKKNKIKVKFNIFEHVLLLLLIISLVFAFINLNFTCKTVYENGDLKYECNQ